MLQTLAATKNRRPLLLAFCCLVASFAAAQANKPRILKLTSRAGLFEKLAGSLDAYQLLRTYRPDLKLVRVTRNRHEPAVRDSLLQVSTPADKLTLFKNRYNALLRKATITSARVSFAGLRVGVAQADFCRALHLRPGYDRYVITDGMKNFVQLSFTFTGNKLQRVEYRELVDMEEVD